MHKLIFTKHLPYYIIIGTIATTVDTAIFYYLSKWLAFPLILANGFSLFIGVLLSFYLNSHFNFHKKDKFTKRLSFFSVVLFVGMIIGTSLISLFINVFSMNIVLAKILSVMIAGVFQYIFNCKITFS
ncbi:MAG: GtrA family protein [Clostridiales bacterium]|nr:GtrA family protein [Clostridiales bacterium]